jgi:hypothetical protein
VKIVPSLRKSKLPAGLSLILPGGGFSGFRFDLARL